LEQTTLEGRFLTDKDYQLLDRDVYVGDFEHLDQYDAPTRNEVRAIEASERALRICFRILDGELVINGRPATELLYEALRNACHSGSGFTLGPDRADRGEGTSFVDHEIVKDIKQHVIDLAAGPPEYMSSSDERIKWKENKRSQLRVLCLALCDRQKEGKLQITKVP
jgi:hypothetical protein